MISLTLPLLSLDSIALVTTSGMRCGDLDVGFVVRMYLQSQFVHHDPQLRPGYQRSEDQDNLVEKVLLEKKLF